MTRAYERMIVHIFIHFPTPINEIQCTMHTSIKFYRVTLTSTLSRNTSAFMAVIMNVCTTLIVLHMLTKQGRLLCTIA